MQSTIQSTSEQPDVVIVGGGLAGLTAATYLARQGASVTLFEKAADLGGRAAIQTVNGYAFNRGVHALYCGGAAEDVLRELNIAYSGHSPKGIHVLHDGKLSLAPVGFGSLLGTAALGIADKLELMQVFTSIGSLKPESLRWTSTQAWIDQAAHRPLVRQLLMTNASTLVYCSALDIVSAELFVGKTQRTLKHPILYIDGGWETFVSGLRSAAEQAGARIISSARVESVEYTDGVAHGVRLSDGRIVYASAVIIAAAPHDAVKLVDGGSYSPLRQIVDSLVPAQVACLDVALSRLPDSRYPVVQDIDATRFMSAQSVFSRVAPDGGAIIYSFKQLDPERPSDPKDDERDLEAFLDTVQPGWRDVLIKRYTLPRIDATGALPLARSGGFAGRPGPQVPGIAGLYLVGDWIGDDGFLADASMASARQVATMIRETLPPQKTHDRSAVAAVR